MKNTARIVASILITSLLGNVTLGAEKERKLNVIFFLVDDLGWSDVGCYGSTFHETPNIDRLARDGVRFDNAYATCHVCSPSRASILTGKYPARTDLTEWLGGRPERNFEKLHSAKKLMSLPDEEITLTETLKQHGYATADFGKAHLRKDPKSYGFDEAITGWVRSYYYPFSKQYEKTLPAKKGDYYTDKLTDAALDFIERKKDQPFFLYIPHTIPADSVCDELATAMDILLTFVHMAGGRDPQDRIIDGYDIRPLILGDPGATSP